MQTDKYLLACSRYTELNPVRAGMFTDAGSYPWSSCRQHIGSADIRWIDLDLQFLGLSTTDAGRAIHYRRLLEDDLRTDEKRTIQKALQRGPLTGDGRFGDEVAAIRGR